MIKINKSYNKIWYVSVSMQIGEKPKINICEYDNAIALPSVSDPSESYCDISSGNGTRPFCYRKSIFDNEPEAIKYKEYLTIKAEEKKKQYIQEGITLLKEILKEGGINDNKEFVALKHEGISFNKETVIVNNEKYGKFTMNITDITNEEFLCKLLTSLINYNIFVLSTNIEIGEKMSNATLSYEMCKKIDKLIYKFKGYYFWE